MELPQKFLDSLNGIKGFDREAFVQVHNAGEQVTSIRTNRKIVLAAERGTAWPFNREGQEMVPWNGSGMYLRERPRFTFEPLFHGGFCYVQEASGMFLEHAARETIDLVKPLKVLDLCAAPGGKSTLLHDIINRESLLVSNEVIKSRAAILEENMTKWSGLNIVVTNNDPKDFARLENFFDVIIVDAPCSGSGLFRREPEAVKEWSEQNVQLCHQRQQRILADVYPALRQDGVLIYCTCSYSKEENEDILDWISDEFSVESLPLKIEDAWGIVPVQSGKHKAHGYRFWPDKVKGEGFFIACFRKKDGDEMNLKTPTRLSLQKVSKKEAEIVEPWIRQKTPERLYMRKLPPQLWKQGDLLFAFTQSLEKELLIIAANLYIRMAGVRVGKIAGNELIPDHALALSTIVGDEIVAVSLKKEEALQYLRKEEVFIETSHRGWALVRYDHFNIGWVKVLANRINNYYPKEWRILKKF